LLLRIIPAWQNARSSHFAKLPGSLYAIASQHTKLFFILFFANAPTRTADSNKRKRFIFWFYYAPSYGQASAEPAAARCFAGILLGQSSNAPNPFGCSFFIKQNPYTQSQRFVLLYKKSSRCITLNPTKLFSSLEKIR